MMKRSAVSFAEEPSGVKNTVFKSPGDNSDRTEANSAALSDDSEKGLQ